MSQDNISEVRRKLLKIGVYTAPALIFLGKVSAAHTSGHGITKKSKDCLWIEELVNINGCK